MYRKILLSGMAILCCSQSFAAWEFRGEPNSWGITPLLPVGGDRHFIRQSFSASQDEFKIAKDGSWAISFPIPNFIVAPGKVYDITFFEGNKTIQADAVPAIENWVFRGTPNSWTKTTMTKSGNNYVTCQNFGAATTDPRFRVMNGNKADWVEAYPTGDQRVAANTSFDITFNPTTRGIQMAARTSSCAAPFVVNIDRSLYVRDQAMLNISNSSGPVFGLDKVLAQLAVQFNAINPSRPTSGGELFARMWDTQNPPPGAIAEGPKCTGVLNGFEHRCRPVEGVQASSAFEFISKYKPVSIVNRFDLRDKVNFSNCGEARIIYALTDTSAGRNFIIFEAQLPNPQVGVASGCKPIADFWKDLTLDNDDTSRARKLRDFYFSGIPAQNIRAVIDIRNYAPATGQIRTNQFMSFDPWVLKEFKLVVEGGLSIVKPVSVKANPTGFQFNEASRGNASVDALSAQFRTQFLNNMGTLINPDVNQFFLAVQDDRNNNGQSHANSVFSLENSFATHASAGFRSAIQSRGVQLGSTLTTAQILNRATAMTCGGCHNPSTFSLTVADSIGTGKSWPDSLGFTHVDETNVVNGKFNISPALLNVFLPARKVDFEAFINSANGAVAAPQGITIQSAPADTSTTAITGKRSG